MVVGRGHEDPRLDEPGSRGADLGGCEGLEDTSTVALGASALEGTYQADGAAREPDGPDAGEPARGGGRGDDGEHQLAVAEEAAEAGRAVTGDAACVDQGGGRSAEVDLRGDQLRAQRPASRPRPARRAATRPSAPRGRSRR